LEGSGLGTWLVAMPVVLIASQQLATGPYPVTIPLSALLIGALVVYVVAFAASRLGFHPLVLPVGLLSLCVTYIVWQWTFIDCLDCYSDGVSIREIRGRMSEATVWAALYLGAVSLTGGVAGKRGRRPLAAPLRVLP
jgi:hypothetical protein